MKIRSAIILLKKISNFLLLNIVPPIAALVVFILSRLVRVKFMNKDSGFIGKEIKPGIYTLWHNQLLLLLGVFAWNNCCVIISKSRDGELIARVAKLLGYKVVRGSSSKSGSGALLEMLKNKEQLSKFVFTVDGPRGPVYEVKAGCIYFASKTGLLLRPTFYKMKKIIKLNSWDKFNIPIPFCRAEIYFGEPVFVEKDLKKEQLDSYKIKLKQIFEA
jgi:lysophospholipid acyltransferase (LPLAT)-like uncharacterized protein